jgi:hypothetical protein
MIQENLKALLAGYVGITDNPGAMFTGDLVAAFPDAIVICTTRDPEKWYASIEDVRKALTTWWLEILFLSRPTLRYFGPGMKGMANR